MPYADPQAQRVYQREWIARRRIEYFADKCCVECGATEELMLDHIDWRDKISHKIWSWSAERRSAELAKCQVLCWPCHRTKTWTQDLPEQGRCVPTNGTCHHGTWGRYKRGCSCGLCRLKNINYKRSRRSSGRQRS